MSVPYHPWHINHAGRIVTAALDAILRQENQVLHPADLDEDTEEIISDTDSSNERLYEAFPDTDSISTISARTSRSNSPFSPSMELQQWQPVHPDADSSSAEEDEEEEDPMQRVFYWDEVENLLLNELVPRFQFHEFQNILFLIAMTYDEESMEDAWTRSLRDCQVSGSLHVFEAKRRCVQCDAQLCEVSLESLPVLLCPRIF